MVRTTIYRSPNPTSRDFSSFKKVNEILVPQVESSSSSSSEKIEKIPAPDVITEKNDGDGEQIIKVQVSDNNNNNNNNNNEEEEEEDWWENLDLDPMQEPSSESTEEIIQSGIRGGDMVEAEGADGISREEDEYLFEEIHVDISEDNKKISHRAMDTPMTARTAPATDDDQSDFLVDLDEIGNEETDQKHYPDAEMLSIELESYYLHPPYQSSNPDYQQCQASKEQTANSFTEKKEVGEQVSSSKPERKKMSLPCALCFAATIIIVSVAVFLAIRLKRGEDENELTVVPVTMAPTGSLRTMSPTGMPIPVNDGSVPSSHPSLYQVPTVSPPPGIATDPPIPRPTDSPSSIPTTTMPTAVATDPPISRPTDSPSSIPTTTMPTAAVTTANPRTISPSILPPQLPAEEQSNDDCFDAIGPLPADGYIITEVTGDLRAATPDVVDQCGDVTTRGPGVWFTVLGTGGEMTAHTCVNSAADTKISVFKGACLKPECIDGNDNFCGSQSAVSWQSNYRQVYRILVSGPDTPFSMGTFSLTIESMANDECETAAGPLTIGSGPLVLGSTLLVNSDAIDCDGEVIVSPIAWYKIRGTGADVTVSACLGSDFNVRLSVFVGVCRSLSCVARSEVDACSITFTSSLFVDYYVAIHGTESADAGEFGLRLTTSAVRDNDSCENAIGPLLLEAGESVSGSTVGATAERGAPFCDGAVTAPGVWYSFIGTGNQFQAALCNDSSYDTRLSIYEGNCDGNDYSGLTCVQANDDFCGQQSLVIFQTEVGAIYQILVHGYLLASGDFTLEVIELNY